MSINPTIYIDEHEEEENNKNAIKKRKTNLIRDPKKGMVIIQSQHNLNLILRKHSNKQYNTVLAHNMHFKLL